MLKICLVFCKSEPRYAYKLHAYKKKTCSYTHLHNYSQAIKWRRFNAFRKIKNPWKAQTKSKEEQKTFRSYLVQSTLQKYITKSLAIWVKTKIFQFKSIYMQSMYLSLISTPRLISNTFFSYFRPDRR